MSLKIDIPDLPEPDFNGDHDYTFQTNFSYDGDFSLFTEVATTFITQTVAAVLKKYPMLTYWNLSTSYTETDLPGDEQISYAHTKVCYNLIWRKPSQTADDNQHVIDSN